MSKPVRYLVIGVLAALAIGAGIWYRTTSESPNAGGPGAQRPTGPVRVDAAVVHPVAFSESLVLNGEIMPAEHVDIYPEISGRIVGIDVREGAIVRPGQVLFRLDDAVQKAQLHKLQAQFVIDSVQLQRLESLKKVDGVSMQDLDAARAQVKIRKAEIESAEDALRKTRITASFAGKVGLRMVSVGAVVSPQTLLTTLSDVTSLKMDVSIPDRYAFTIRDGSTLRCVAHSNKGADTIQAQVYAQQPTLDQGTRTLRVRAHVPAKAAVVPGTIVDVILNTSAIPNAILIPTQAVQQGMKGASVFVLNGSRVREVNVELGGRTADKVHVLHGLTEGDTIATSGLLVLKNGMPAQPIIKQ